jgi:hypothetical protein
MRVALLLLCASALADDCHTVFTLVCGQFEGKGQECADCLQAHSAHLQASGYIQCTDSSHGGLERSAQFCSLSMSRTKFAMVGEYEREEDADSVVTTPAGMSVHSEDDDDAAASDPANKAHQDEDDDDDKQEIPVTPAHHVSLATSNRPVRKGTPNSCDEELQMYCTDTDLTSSPNSKAQTMSCLSCVQQHMGRIDRGLKTKCDEDQLAVKCDPQLAGKSGDEAVACEKKVKGTCGYDVEKAAGCNACMKQNNFAECSSFQQSFFCYFYTWGTDDSGVEKQTILDTHLGAPPTRRGQTTTPSEVKGAPNPSCNWALSTLCAHQYQQYKEDPSAVNYVSCLRCAKVQPSALNLGCGYDSYAHFCKRTPIPHKKPTCKQWMDQMCSGFAETGHEKCLLCVNKRMGLRSLQAKLGMFSCTTDDSQEQYCSSKQTEIGNAARCLKEELPKLCPDSNNKFRRVNAAAASASAILFSYYFLVCAALLGAWDACSPKRRCSNSAIVPSTRRWRRNTATCRRIEEPKPNLAGWARRMGRAKEETGALPTFGVRGRPVD